MFDAKYVAFRGHLYDVIFVFSAGMKHSEFAESMKWFGEPVGAGFVSRNVSETGPDELTCYGRSESMNLDSRGDKDTILLNQTLMDKNYDR